MRLDRSRRLALLTAVIAVLASTSGWAADTNLAASTAAGSETHSLPLVVTRTRLLYLGPGAALLNSTPTLRAKLEDFARTPIPGQTVLFRLGPQVCFATTDGAGIASCPVHLTGTTGPRALQIFFDGDATYGYSTLFSKIVVIAPPPGP
jgi:hypothetical protein